jgi:hypothetical protein
LARLRLFACRRNHSLPLGQKSGYCPLSVTPCSAAIPMGSTVTCLPQRSKFHAIHPSFSTWERIFLLYLRVAKEHPQSLSPN